ncbi:hypothetical protein P691DRAFT_340662 [Macrolepiota fuliginosa MF-IS2]|uniref:Transmembrane protein n=1 Tax=Macrolepiota fuliginosa MF-IS2 TaxID=1400762 RepID=A0A9P5X5N3_9AGAR|nr:hypothetical protein P691DRAFT_340662 [Macrolepiota fuliginosa MF-IS2]
MTHVEVPPCVGGPVVVGEAGTVYVCVLLPTRVKWSTSGWLGLIFHESSARGGVVVFLFFLLFSRFRRWRRLVRGEKALLATSNSSSTSNESESESLLSYR